MALPFVAALRSASLSGPGVPPPASVETVSLWADCAASVPAPLDAAPPAPAPAFVSLPSCNAVFPLDAPAGYKDYDVLAVLFFFLHRHLDHSAYLAALARAAANLDVAPVSFIDRRDLLAFLAGSISSSIHVKLSLDPAPQITPLSHPVSISSAPQKSDASEVGGAPSAPSAPSAAAGGATEDAVENAAPTPTAPTPTAAAASSTPSLPHPSSSIATSLGISNEDRFAADLQAKRSALPPHVIKDHHLIRSFRALERTIHTPASILSISANKSFANIQKLAFESIIRVKDDKLAHPDHRSSKNHHPSSSSSSTAAALSAKHHPKDSRVHKSSRDAHPSKDPRSKHARPSSSSSSSASHAGHGSSSSTSASLKAAASAVVSASSGASSLSKSHASKRPDPKADKSSKSGKSPIPIIIVPAAAQSLLTLYNIKDFLIDQKFVHTDTYRNRGEKKPMSVMLERDPKKIPSGAQRKFLILDAVDTLHRHDWDRIVAVFTNGQEWQFRSWKWEKPVDIFHNVLGFVLKFQDEPMPGMSASWKTEVLNIHRSRRYLDGPVVYNFWKMMDAFITNDKAKVFGQRS